jgi:hypothetical protein
MNPAIPKGKVWEHPLGEGPIMIGQEVVGDPDRTTSQQGRSV